MNERIQELAGQANITVRGYYDETGSTPAELQRFAELIIKECAKKVADFRKEDEEDEYICHSASEVIKRHFGVE